MIEKSRPSYIVECEDLRIGPTLIEGLRTSGSIKGIRGTRWSRFDRFAGSGEGRRLTSVVQRYVPNAELIGGGGQRGSPQEEGGTADDIKIE